MRFAHNFRVDLMVINEQIIFDVNESDFDQRVIAASANKPILVDFWAEWCPPCRALTPVLEKIAGRLKGEVLLAKVEVDDNMHLAGRYDLRGFPTAIIFINGEEQGRFSGFKPEAEVMDFLADSNAVS